VTNTVSDGTEDDSEGVETAQMIVGAWREALDTQGVERVALVSLVSLITIPFSPFWALLITLEIIGVYSPPTNRSTETGTDDSTEGSVDER